MSQETQSYGRPLPLMRGLAGEFYDYCRRHELRFQKCADCGRWRHVPRATCAACGSWEWRWERASGRGTVFTWTVVRRPMHPAFAGEAPYAPVVIALEEGLRLVSWLVDCPPEEIRMGLPVEVVFDDVSPEATLPRFRRRGD